MLGVWFGIGAASLMPGCGDDEVTPPAECEDDCFQAPAPVCDGNVSTVYLAPGVCGDDAVCSFDSRVESCEFGCDEGVCLPDPCDGVNCPVPARPACDGDILVTTRVGTCTDGACIYPESRLDCASLGQVCASGACVDVDPCEDVDCSTPPEPTCTDDGRSILVSSAGRCVDGECEYSTSLTECSGDTPACVDGACEADPLCEGVVCDEPPPGFCVDRVATTFGNPVCVRGVCEWEAIEDDCRRLGQICEDAACEPIPCADVACLEAPDDMCDGDVAVDYTGDGECRDDLCVYASLRTDCAARREVCEDGRCVDPCAGVACDAPPVDSCSDEGVASDYPAGGICEDGVCVYEPQMTDCSALGLICSSGRCLTECALAACDSPEPDVCAGPVAIDAGVFPGDCNEGVCSYGRETLVCPAEMRCLDGACVDALDCDDDEQCATPAPFCLGNVVHEFSGNGVCDSGSCAFDETLTTIDCGESDQFCEDGACVDADPCLELGCEVPEPICQGPVVVQYGPALSCERGACDYERTTINCAELAQQCIDGACAPLSVCDGVDCSAIAASTCASDTEVRSYTGTGTCDPSTAACTVDAPFVVTPCAEGSVCTDGVCTSVPAYGNLVVTELSLRPYAGFAAWQWIEVYNATDAPIPARAISLQNEVGSRRVLEADTSLAPGSFTVLASQRGGFVSTPFLGWTAASPLFGPSAGTVEVYVGDTLVDSVEYGTEAWPFVVTGSLAVDGPTDADDNNTPARWCASDQTYDTDYQGSPGAVNALCVTLPPPP